MTKQEHHLRINQRVRLKLEGQDALYKFACAGSEGWVRKQKYDELGYPKVFIEWDKDHWAYNGEKDQWVLEAHFEPVKGENMSDDLDTFQMFQKFQQFLASQNGESVPEESTEPTVDQRYADALTKANEIAAEADAFLTIAVTRKPTEDGVPALMPIVVNGYKNDESALVLELQLARLGLSSFEQLTLAEIQRTLDSRG
jgi:hypothetical protein